LRLDLEHPHGTVERRKHGGDDALAERVVEGIVDRRRQDPIARRGVAVNRDVEARSGICLVAGDIGDARMVLSLSRNNGAQ